MKPVMAPEEDAPRLVLLSDQTWWLSSLESVFGRSGYLLLKAPSLTAAVDRIAVFGVDAIIIHAPSPIANAIEISRSLRERAGIGDEVPILVVFDSPKPRRQWAEALRAGAWECFAPPVDAELLLLKVERFIAAKRSADRVRSQCFVEETTGLYSLNGLLWRLRELGDMAHRYHRPLGCAVFGVGSTPIAGEPAGGVHSVQNRSVESVARLLTANARTADVVGRLNRREFVVLSPETESAGVLAMAQRFVDAAKEWSDDSVQGGLALCAGCYGVTDFAEARIEPVEAILRATEALRRAQAGLGDGSSVQFFDLGELN